MKKIVICNIPMRENVAKTVYSSEDSSLPVSEKPYRYPINSFLSQTITNQDDLKIILLIKKDGNVFYEKNTEDYRREIEDICVENGATAEFVFIDTDFSQDKENHEQLMGRIVDEIEIGAHVMVDITYGPKDLPIVIFTALSFAEKFLKCEIENIVYGQATFEGDKVVESRICDMIPLYCLSSVTNTIKCDDPQKARKMLKSLLSI
ncbi:CRISPR-associated (Cas) DxTHG family protein [Lachnospiraceae bacterium C10]|nr:CRISPR-associated (Cas) DxTHG family protein [Lachnospiraceae bacterium C10]